MRQIGWVEEGGFPAHRSPREERRPDRESAETIAVEAFKLTAEQRRQLVVTERRED
jgi:hypothetical protein